MSGAKRMRALLVGLAVILPGVAMAGAPAEPDALAVVVHRNARIDELTTDGLRRLFMGDQQYWPDGAKVVILIQSAGTEERRQVLSTVFRMSEAEYKQFWIGRIFRGDATSGPKIVPDRRAIPELVGTISGAIAVIRVQDLTPAVKAIRIGGKLPGEPGYLSR